jgi:hypothetical protein
MFKKIDRKDVKTNFVWLIIDGAGFYSQAIIGDLADLKYQILLSECEIDVLLDFGMVKSSPQAVETFNWHIGDIIKLDDGLEYIIASVSISTFPNGFEVFLMDRINLHSKIINGNDFDLNINYGTYSLIEEFNKKDNEEISDNKTSTNSIKYCRGGSDCKVVDSFMISGEKFKYCKKHGLEVK